MWHNHSSCFTMILYKHYYLVL
ncbi:hypothetical protein NSPZN2_70026 [Nitrospira defluvii]|uniref:Uncharacterized protein n=1 Tax=Nitrospira defluvii TaxID=330214 RepID=A0ABN7MAG1_9BACT|nr:hypothetical protein NSPZN2_70026 [Nitrospira defluvii]